MRLCFVEACALVLTRVAQDVESRSKALGLIGLQRARFGHLGFVIQAPSLQPEASFYTVELLVVLRVRFPQGFKHAFANRAIRSFVFIGSQEARFMQLCVAISDHWISICLQFCKPHSVVGCIRREEKIIVVSVGSHKQNLSNFTKSNNASTGSSMVSRSVVM
jgi:hypothetical protein